MWFILPPFSTLSILPAPWQVRETENGGIQRETNSSPPQREGEEKSLVVARCKRYWLPNLFLIYSPTTTPFLLLPSPCSISCCNAQLHGPPLPPPASDPRQLPSARPFSVLSIVSTWPEEARRVGMVIGSLSHCLSSSVASLLTSSVS